MQIFYEIKHLIWKKNLQASWTNMCQWLQVMYITMLHKSRAIVCVVVNVCQRTCCEQPQLFCQKIWVQESFHIQCFELDSNAYMTAVNAGCWLARGFALFSTTQLCYSALSDSLCLEDWFLLYWAIMLMSKLNIMMKTNQ